MTGKEPEPMVADHEAGPLPASPDDVGAGNITRLPLTSQVATIIRDMIIQDIFKPGERIRERQLSEELNVSRTPLREALKILEGEKLIELLPNRGAIVADPAPREVLELLQVLGALEALGGRLAAEKATDAEISEIRALHFEMLAAYSRKDQLTYFKLNQKIHTSIIAASRNKSLIETHRHFNARLYRVRYRSNQRNAKWHEAIDQHEGFITALEARDGELLARRMADHLSDTWVKVSLDDYPVQPEKPR
ncbi:MAG: GntR family transcriptional regulator [Rhodospirillales bacterium]|nr:GntR family transcriptional regulator [Rhodospirillales bacterium]